MDYSPQRSRQLAAFQLPVSPGTSSFLNRQCSTQQLNHCHRRSQHQHLTPAVRRRASFTQCRPSRSTVRSSGSEPQEPDDQQQIDADSERDAMTSAGITLLARRAVKSYLSNQGSRPSPKILAYCLRELEQVQKKNKHQCDIQNLYGQWRLIFTSNKNSSFNTYFPLHTRQTFYKESVQFPELHNGEFDNAVFLLGTFAYFRISGPLRWVEKNNRMEFSVDSLYWNLGPFNGTFRGLDKKGYSLQNRSVKDLPFFTFCCIREDIAVARGRTGGMALYTRIVDEDKYL